LVKTDYWLENVSTRGMINANRGGTLKFPPLPLLRFFS